MILAYAQKNHLAYRHDESNDDLRFTRNQLRHELVPALKKGQPDLIERVHEMMIDAQTRWHDVRSWADNWLNEHYRFHRFERAAFLKLPRDVQVEVLFSLVDPNGIYEKTIQSILNLIQSGETGKQRTVQAVTFLVDYDQMSVTRNASKLEQPPQGRKPLAHRLIYWHSWRLKNSSKKSLWVRSWQPGDRFEPNGMTGTKKVQDFFVDQKIPRAKRALVPIIVDEHDEIVAIGSHRFSEKGALLKPFLHIESA
ncbi:tRNA lysidine(34) synthetase TilS [Candidatus Peregrinibacteria bacterium]|nr:MAG: tRNA lysidine(34) synthetase TilS [Candidatus Peregrinibacteria bacterium]